MAIGDYVYVQHHNRASPTFTTIVRYLHSYTPHATPTKTYIREYKLSGHLNHPMDNDEHEQSNGDTSTAPTINQNDFNFLIDLLGTSDVEDVESVGVSANFDASFAVEDLLGLGASLGGIPENSAPVPQSVHDRSRVGREEDTGRLSGTAEEPLRANESTFTRNGAVLSPGIHLHRAVNDTPNRPGSLCPSPSFPGQMRLSITETPSSPQLAGADMSSLPISPLQLASRDFLPNDPDVNDVQFGQKQRGQRVSPRVAPSTRQAGNRSSHPDLSQTSSRAEMMVGYIALINYNRFDHRLHDRTCSRLPKPQLPSSLKWFQRSNSRSQLCDKESKNWTMMQENSLVKKSQKQQSGEREAGNLLRIHEGASLVLEAENKGRTGRHLKEAALQNLIHSRSKRVRIST